MKNKIAVTHPGKIGDLLYAIPVVKELCRIHNTQADFFTSSYCEPVRSLLEYQPYIDKMIVPDEKDYKVESFHMGGQPWLMDLDFSEYEGVYQLGFKRVPNKSIPEFIAEEAGLSADIGKKIELEYDDLSTIIDDNYIVIAPRGLTSFSGTFKDFYEDFYFNTHLEVIIIGGEGEYQGFGIDYTGCSFLHMTSLIANSKGFVGLMSSPLVIANAFDIPKVVVHDGKSWDMNHVMYSDLHKYLVNPNSKEIIRGLNL